MNDEFHWKVDLSSLLGFISLCKADQLSNAQKYLYFNHYVMEEKGKKYYWKGDHAGSQGFKRHVQIMQGISTHVTNELYFLIPI